MGMSEEAKIAGLEARVEEHGREIRRNTDNIETLTSKVSDLTVLTESVKAIADKLSSMSADITSIKSSQNLLQEKINELEGADGERALKFLDGIKEKVIWTVLAALLGFTVAQIFPFTVM